ncbi:hypothetical protein PanWU01x14_030260 [Parasponia andersonii]|uniref:Uncharacterized protein n=1 Tax=Parasponia andersonii TaxID=3476 RepID=A0A2P5DUR6_PARAD|nr:hypothetical protein PanWU01x14_030260 [Parasponia andersonii]
MRCVLYASAVGGFMYVMLYTSLTSICYAVGIVSHFQSNLGLVHWVTVKHILMYLRRLRNYMLVYSSKDMIPVNYIDFDFQSDKDTQKSISSLVFIFYGRDIV